MPKTLVFAKDDSHAEDIVRIIREEFGRGNEFCQKITYKVTGVKPEDLIASFRNSYNPRIAVTVDMISTGTDIKPLEVLLFMRPVRSRLLFEQMMGRGTRVISHTDLQAVTPDTNAQDPLCHRRRRGRGGDPKLDTKTMERKRTVPFDKLLEQVALGVRDDDALTSLAGRLARLRRKLAAEDEDRIEAASGGLSLRDLANALLDAVDPDQHLALAQAESGEERTHGGSRWPRPRRRLVAQAVAPFDNPQLRQTLIAIHERAEQIIDTVSVDRVLGAGFSDEQASQMVTEFRQFIEENRDEITALQIIYSQPYARQQLTRPRSRSWPTGSNCRLTPGRQSRCGGPTPNWRRTGCVAWVRSGC